MPNTPGPAKLHSHIHFIMVAPSHPGNVGAAARALKTMGFSRLTLVAPRSNKMSQNPEAIAMASGASDVLHNTAVVNTLEQALANSNLAFALTARPRELGPPASDIRSMAKQASQHLQNYPDNEIALVLGTERSGLDNAAIALCQAVCHIPANPEYSSLNVAQALQLAAWELHYALLHQAGQLGMPQTGRAKPAKGSQPARNKQLHDLLNHLEEALIAIDFLNPQHPKKLMQRLRHFFMRNAASDDEVAIWRGICTAILRNKPSK
ncbi:MAG TPA: RNA methyltransferase [Burkholderiaceae bacterium]|nr:RNA methyltransferase [Burkholderiaceae bacterium]